MKRISFPAKQVFFFILLTLLATTSASSQQKEARRLFLIDDGSAFIDRQGKVIISTSDPRLLEDVKRVHANIGSFWRREVESAGIRFGDFSEGLAVVGWALCPMCRNPFWVTGIIDETGRVIIPPADSNTRFGSFHEGLAQFHNRGVGFIDRSGRIVIPARFYEASDFSEGLALVRSLPLFPFQDKSKFGFINRQGTVVIPYRFEWAGNFHEGLAAVQLSKGRYGFINKTGRVVLYAKEWLEIDDFSEGLARVEVMVPDNTVYRGYQYERQGYIDRTGKFVIAARFNRAWKFSEGRALFFQSGQNYGYGFIDTTGEVVIKPEYADGKSFSEGLAAVAINSPANGKLWGYIDRGGKWVINPRFRQVNSFSGGLAAVNCDQYGRSCQTYVDAIGRVVWQK